MSDCGEDVVPKGGERPVLAFDHGKAVRVDADIAAPLELVSNVNHGPHICAEDGRVNAVALKKGPIRCLVGSSFIEEVRCRNGLGSLRRPLQR